MADVGSLLQQYAVHGSEPAFTELLVRYVDLVYSAARRQVGDDVALAQDITQMIFADLARKAKYLPANIKLGGWLYRRTCFIAKTALRTERRRLRREQEAVTMSAMNQEEQLWHQLAPVLDAALNRLSRADREALVLRFFERQSLKEVGAALDATEDAARMRVDRALEKLRQLLAKQGITSTATALAALLVSQATTAAPAGLAAMVSGPALVSAATGGGLTLTLFKLVAMTKLKIAVTGAIAAACVVTPLTLQHRQNARLRAEVQGLRNQVEQLTQIRDAAERLTEVRPEPNQAAAGQKQEHELLRLRGLIAAQRQQEAELRQRLEAAQTENDIARMQVAAALERNMTHSVTIDPKPTPLTGAFQIATLQPAARDTPSAAVQSTLYAVFHGNVDTFHDLTEARDLTEQSVKETLAHQRQMWGGDAAKGINNLVISPIKDDRYMVTFRIDYGNSPRPLGAPTHGNINLRQTPDGWKESGFGSSIETPPAP